MRCTPALMVALALACGAPVAPPVAAPSPSAPLPTPTAAAMTARPEPTTPAPTPSPREGAMTLGGSLYFVRDGALMRVALADRTERRLFGDVVDYALSPDGARLAFVRGGGTARELSVAPPSGRDSRVVARGAIAELAWSSAGALVYTSSSIAPDRKDDSGMTGWSEWCRTGVVRVWDEARGDRAVASGCHPAWSADGTRLAFAGPPDLERPQSTLPQPDWPTANAILELTLATGVAVDRVRSGSQPAAVRAGSRFLYRPLWTPAGALVYTRFVGYAVLCDHMTVERAGGTGAQLLGVGGWVREVTATGDGRLLALDETPCNAAGFTGYAARSFLVLDLGSPGEVTGSPVIGDYDARTPVGATRVLHERFGHSPAWSPTGVLLAYLAPPASYGPQGPEPASPYSRGGPADVIVRDVAANTMTRLPLRADFGSRLSWSR